jgi:FkbM family methyltransferase
MDYAQEQLDRLLAETLDHARGRREQEFAWFDKELHPLALYGAGTLGRSVLKRLRVLGIEPVAFADDTPEKQGDLVDGVEVMTPSEVVRRFSADTIFVVTILNPQLSFLKAKEKLHAGSTSRVVSFLSLAWRYPEVFLPYYQFEKPESLLEKSAGIKRAFGLWSDEESRRQYVDQLRFRLYLDFESLPANSHEGYFPHDVITPLPDNTVFVDCGAFDGDSIRDFITLQGNNFTRIYAFEPDAINFSRLKEFVAGKGLADKTEIFHAAVGQTRTRVAFNATGNMSATLASDGEETVELLPLDEIVNPDEGLIFLKFDVEGGEDEALNGAQLLLKKAKPIVALSIYHRPDDLWSLPLRLHSFDPDYKYYLRTQGEDGMDVICYAVPAHPGLQQ